MLRATYGEMTISDVEHACCAKKQMGSGSVQKRESGRGPAPAERQRRAKELLTKHRGVLKVDVQKAFLKRRRELGVHVGKGRCK